MWSTSNFKSDRASNLPYGWNEMQGVNLGNLLRSEYWEFELRSFYGAKFSVSSLLRKRNEDRAIKCGFTLNSLKS